MPCARRSSGTCGSLCCGKQMYGPPGVLRPVATATPAGAAQDKRRRTGPSGNEKSRHRPWSCAAAVHQLPGRARACARDGRHAAWAPAPARNRPPARPIRPAFCKRSCRRPTGRTTAAGTPPGIRRRPGMPDRALYSTTGNCGHDDDGWLPLRRHTRRRSAPKRLTATCPAVCWSLWNVPRAAPGVRPCWMPPSVKSIATRSRAPTRAGSRLKPDLQKNIRRPHASSGCAADRAAIGKAAPPAHDEARQLVPAAF